MASPLDFAHTFDVWTESELPRVHDIAREFGLTSRTVLQALADIGEFARAASSRLAPDVADRLRTYLRSQALGDAEEQAAARDLIADGRRPPGLGVEPRRPRSAPRSPSASTTLTIEEEAALRKQRSQCGKRYKGEVDAATRQWLEQRGAHEPPFVDEYETALAETRRWTHLGWIAPEEIVRWRSLCPGITPEVGMGFALAGVSPRLARTRWNGRGLDPEGQHMLYQSRAVTWMSPVPGISVENACWLLREKGLLAS